jgi:secreted trypsin-like serine protease
LSYIFHYFSFVSFQDFAMKLSVGILLIFACIFVSFLFTLLLFFLNICIQQILQSSEAIINGVNYRGAPYMARVQFLLFLGGAGGEGGGAVISRRHVLTTAFVMTENFQVLNVWIGGYTRTTQRQVFVQQRTPHMNYGLNPRLNDIGIITLNADIIFTNSVQPIALPSSDLPQLNGLGKVLGFGGFPGIDGGRSEQLEAAYVTVVTPARCQTQFPQQDITQQFCAEDTFMRSDFCNGDIGALFVTVENGVEVLTGLGSIGRCLENTVPSQPSLYTKVYAFRSWILTTAGV